jgi:hypothetical protein
MAIGNKPGDVHTLKSCNTSRDRSDPDSDNANSRVRSKTTLMRGTTPSAQV